LLAYLEYDISKCWRRLKTPSLVRSVAYGESEVKSFAFARK
jgi:hypothetical protein